MGWCQLLCLRDTTFALKVRYMMMAKDVLQEDNDNDLFLHVQCPSLMSLVMGGVGSMSSKHCIPTLLPGCRSYIQERFKFESGAVCVCDLQLCGGDFG